MRRSVSKTPFERSARHELIRLGVRYSRNPQYLGIVAALSVAVVRRSLVVAGLAAGYGAVVHWCVPVEEATLERKFGDTYRHYRQRVPRWLGARRRATAWTYETVVAAFLPRAFRLLAAPREVDGVLSAVPRMHG